MQERGVHAAFGDTPEALGEGVAALDWTPFLTPRHTLAVRAVCRSSAMTHSGYIAPAGFPVVGGHKVFRDEIWGHMRAVFRADHAWYKKNGMYDFPQNNLRDRVYTTLLSLFLSIPRVRKKAEKEMKEHMVEPFARVFEESPLLKQRGKKD